MTDIGPITVIALRTGPQVAVKGTPGEVHTILEQAKTRNNHFAILTGLDDDPIGIPWTDVGIFSRGQAKEPSAIEVPRPQLLVPGGVG